MRLNCWQIPVVRTAVSGMLFRLLVGCITYNVIANLCEVLGRVGFRKNDRLFDYRVIKNLCRIGTLLRHSPPVIKDGKLSSSSCILKAHKTRLVFLFLCVHDFCHSSAVLSLCTKMAVMYFNSAGTCTISARDWTRVVPRDSEVGGAYRTEWHLDWVYRRIPSRLLWTCFSWLIVTNAVFLFNCLMADIKWLIIKWPWKYETKIVLKVKYQNPSASCFHCN